MTRAERRHRRQRKIQKAFELFKLYSWSYPFTINLADNEYVSSTSRNLDHSYNYTIATFEEGRFAKRSYLGCCDKTCFSCHYKKWMERSKARKNKIRILDALDEYESSSL